MSMTKKKFYSLSCTWGIIMTVIGSVAALVLVITGHKPKKHGWCYRFEVGNGWGGVSLGPVIITAANPSEHTKNHEHGHALQNCLWGPLMPFVIALPSATRYWIRKVQYKQGKNLEPYDSAWFEGDATRRGTEFMNTLGGEFNGDN